MLKLLKSLFFVVWILCSACSKGLSVDLYNNAESPLIVSVGAQKINIEPRQFKSILITAADFKVYQGDLVWRYSRSFYGPQVMSDVGLNVLDPAYVDGDDVIRAQINEGGSIYILRRDWNFPIQDTTSQPPGYPLIPSLF